jgi:hypothetical protein
MKGGRWRIIDNECDNDDNEDSVGDTDDNPISNSYYQPKSYFSINIILYIPGTNKDCPGCDLKPWVA